MDLARQRGRSRPARYGVRTAPVRGLGLHRFAAECRVHRTTPGTEFVGLAYEGPFDSLPGAGVAHRVIGWDEVELDTGTGIVHIAPGAGPEDFVLATVHDLPVLTPVDEAGQFYPDYGWLAGKSVDEASEPIIDDLRERGLLAEAGTVVHPYPHCWRCDTPLIFRVADDWMIAVDGVRQQLLDENANVDWTPAQYGKRMDDWFRNMEDWNISRRRFYGLPLPIYPCTCGHVNVIGSRAELEERAVDGVENLQELHRPWIDEVVIRASSAVPMRNASPRLATSGWTPASCPSPRSDG